MNTEYIEDGYIKLSRRIFNSKTFSNLNAIQKLITIYLILMANYQDNQWWNHHEKKFINIKRGSFITSIESIKKKIKDRLVTTQKIRTLLNILKNMQFLTMETTNKYTLITIIKYDLYQNGENYSNKKINKLATSKQQGNNKVITINNNGNNVKNVNNGKKKIDSAKYRTMLREQIIYYLNTTANKDYKPETPLTIKLINLRLKEGYSLDDFKKVIDVKNEEWRDKITKDGKNMEDWLRPQTLFGNKFESYLNQRIIGRSLEEKLATDHRFDNLK